MRRPFVFKPAHRLTALMRAPGGVSVEDAIARAEQGVESLRASCMEALDSRIEELGRVSSAASLETVYALASEVFNLSATFKLRELSEAAASFCSLLASVQAAAESHRDARFEEALRVHIDALRTLRRPDLDTDAAARRAVVEGLRKVADKGKGDTPRDENSR